MKTYKKWCRTKVDIKDIRDTTLEATFEELPEVVGISEECLVEISRVEDQLVVVCSEARIVARFSVMNVGSLDTWQKIVQGEVDRRGVHGI